jgi:hypothetical protein
MDTPFYSPSLMTPVGVQPPVSTMRTVVIPLLMLVAVGLSAAALIKGGTVGDKGVQGPKGNPGVNIVGKDGKDGKDGGDGRDGRDGRDGKESNIFQFTYSLNGTDVHAAINKDNAVYVENINNHMHVITTLSPSSVYIRGTINVDTETDETQDLSFKIPLDYILPKTSEYTKERQWFPDRDVLVNALLSTDTTHGFSYAFTADGVIQGVLNSEIATSEIATSEIATSEIATVVGAECVYFDMQANPDVIPTGIIKFTIYTEYVL